MLKFSTYINIFEILLLCIYGWNMMYGYNSQKTLLN
jgi:hypothetical protein